MKEHMTNNLPSHLALSTIKAFRRTAALTSLFWLAWTGLAHAQDAARVISRTANLQQVLVPSSYCAQRLAPAPAVHAERSNAGAVVGAIAGGLLGSTLSTEGVTKGLALNHNNAAQLPAAPTFSAGTPQHAVSDAPARMRMTPYAQPCDAQPCSMPQM